MIKVFNYMAVALGITGITAYLVSTSAGLINLLYQTPLQWVIMFAPIVFVVIFASKISTMRLDTARMLFLSFAVMMGLSLSWIFIAYTGTSVARVFFISASMFGAMALYGNNTKKDLSAMGSFLMMGVIGLIIASIINLFLGSSALQFAVSFLAVIIFTGLTAYDVQKIKDSFFMFNDGNEATASKFAIIGALTLYFDFINIFINLLHLIGERR
jgi:FtsH-binding integral membrane protein